MYLDAHPDLTQYVIVDDENMAAHFPGHFVYCDSAWMTERIANRILRIFWDGFWWERNRQGYMPDTNDRDGFEKVVFLDIDGVLNDDSHGGQTIDETMVSRLHRIVADRCVSRFLSP